MKSRAALFLVAVTLAVLVGAIVTLFRWRVGAGDVFPAYSSLRADPLGTRALHDSLAELPGVEVERQFDSLDHLASQPPRTILLAGVSAAQWEKFHWEEFDALDAAVRGGSRIVITMLAANVRDNVPAKHKDAPRVAPKPVNEPKKPEAEKKADAKKESDTKTEANAKKEADGKAKKKDDSDTNADEMPEQPPIRFADIGRRWGATLTQRVLVEREGGAVRTTEAGATDLPARLRWKSDAYFEPESSAGWRVLYRRGGSPVLLERDLGRGSIVLAAESYFLSNEALQRDRSPALLAWMIGPNARVVFDEGHLGVEVQRGVASLARRYGLVGAFFTLLLLAGLFVWRQSSMFVPPAPEQPEVALTYHPAAGLELLLRRAVPPTELAAACLDEWKRTARESDQARVKAALAGVAANAPAVTQYNLAVRALRKR